MNINGVASRSIWIHPEDSSIVQTFDQRYFPHRIEIVDLKSLEDAFHAIKDMIVRGAPLIGVTAAYGLYLACLEGKDLHEAAAHLNTSRPTAVNLAWALEQQLQAVKGKETAQQAATLLQNGQRLADEDVNVCFKIGQFGLELIRKIAQEKNGEPVNILTHCNAGWLACIDWGTATSPIYQAHAEGIPIHVWVDETRPRNQGANLTAFELGQQQVPHTLIVDNTGGHLMQHGMVDMVIVGTDRTTRQGDVANKIGTYLKALAAHDNRVPFYVALPSSTIDWDLRDGLSEIPIEARSEDEVKYMQGQSKDGLTQQVLIAPEHSPAANYGFDVTPARLVSGLITERGVCEASEEGLLQLFPEHSITTNIP